MRLFRLFKIATVASRFGLDQMVLEHEPTGRPTTTCATR